MACSADGAMGDLPSVYVEAMTQMQVFVERARQPLTQMGAGRIDLNSTSKIRYREMDIS
jgi:hypothetical protein